jgi:murein DD-endopeptidase MepM/ murein hydrolase activator NlpD
LSSCHKACKNRLSTQIIENCSFWYLNKIDNFGDIDRKMAKHVKYFYNTNTLKYEKVEISIWKKLSRVFGFLATSVLFSLIIIAIAYTYLDSPKEKQLKDEIDALSEQYDILKAKMGKMEIVLNDLQDRDDNIYRTIFEAEPIALDIRKAGFGGVDRYKKLESSMYSSIMIDATKKLDKISKQLYVQSKSYDEITELVKRKSEMLSSIPAIQPISNKKLSHVGSGYGYRIHPIYKTRKMHTGMDFTAPTGTEIYATGDGIVVSPNSQMRGYGRYVVISHGFGYSTLYAHMSRIAVRVGQRVKRGQVIGYVGNTGASTAPHLHYEVRRANRPVNPINFYFNDLDPLEYEMMLEISSRSNQSFD